MKAQARIDPAQRRQYVALFIASALGLYFEMLIVRWLARLRGGSVMRGGSP